MEQDERPFQLMSDRTALNQEALHTIRQTLTSSPAGHRSHQYSLACLRDMLQSSPLSCSIYELIRLYAECYKRLPEPMKADANNDLDNLIASTDQLIKSSYGSILDLLPTGHSPAIVDGATGRSISQFALSKFVHDFRIPSINSSSASRIVAVVLPNGPLLGLLSIAVAAHYTLAPINASICPEQLRSDILSTGAKTMLVLEDTFGDHSSSRACIQGLVIDVYLVRPQHDLTCTIQPLQKFGPTTDDSHHVSRPNSADDTCIILSTSGTTGTKKIVPITVHHLVSGVAFIGDSWALSATDSCINMMPLNHVGGLVRSLYSPILLGGSTICCSAFDPNLFWDLVIEQKATWYYASPSMHLAILAEAPNAQDIATDSRIRMVCNAAGSLMPSLAAQLRTTFGCTVLPSYGMTECMPISTPPMDYRLERPGTSGISIGPELAILDSSGRQQSSGTLGRISIRGNPSFAGYLVDNKLDRSCFNAAGWFDTGDIGYLDEDGYLFITGRSKEVINRGGEIISPYEIEEAIMAASSMMKSPIFGRVSQTLAFSVPHQTLQEAVGVVIVTPSGKPRIDLRQLQEAIKQLLHPTKWPVVLVYMDDVPKRNGKLVRSQLGQRLELEPLIEDARIMPHHFEASCPAPNTSLAVKIKKQQCLLDNERTSAAITSCCSEHIDILLRTNYTTGFADAFLAPETEYLLLEDIDIPRMKLDLQQILHGYLVPHKFTILDTPFERDIFGQKDASKIDAMLHSRIGSAVLCSPTQKKVCEIFSDILSMAVEDLGLHSDFFEIGGDSLKAGRLLSTIRKEFGVRIPIDRLFNAGTVESLCDIIKTQNPSHRRTTSQKIRNLPQLPPDHKTYSSTNIFTLALHLAPLAVLMPAKKALLFTVFLRSWSLYLKHMTAVNTFHFIYLLLCFGIAKVVLAIVLPIVAITCKWIIIGRYREGLYPMWSTYHHRWWIVSKIIHVCGMGVFSHLNWSRVLFYRLLGAKIGRNVLIQPETVLGEYDLLEIGDDVELDRCIARGFAAERNTTMYLGRIRMGARSAAGLKTILAPGSSIPADTCLGMSSSSWEYKTADDANYDSMASKIPQPHWLLMAIIGIPFFILIKFVSWMPWFAGLSGLNVRHHPNGDVLRFVFGWFSSPTRVAYHFLARILHVLFAPIVFLALVIALKQATDMLFGKIRPSLAVSRSQLDRLRMAMMAMLIPNGNLSEVTDLFGTHYEITSIIVRALGGKVGKNVYWPGNGPSVQNFDMLVVADDVVFGSRAHLVSSDGLGCETIRIDSGAMVADRVVLLPGCQVGKQAVLGSGTLTQRNTFYAPKTTWIGSKPNGPICLTFAGNKTPPANCHPMPIPSELPIDLESVKKRMVSFEAMDDDSSCLTPDGSSNSILLAEEKPKTLSKNSSTTPFGRAFYGNNAPYHVFSLAFVSFYSCLANVLISVYWNLPTVLAVQLLNRLANHSALLQLYSESGHRTSLTLGSLFLAISVIQVIQSILALAICIASKWLIVGRRQPGSYDWDKSSYCQRWKLLLTIERIRRKQLSGQDLLELLTGTYFCVLFFRLMGARIGKDCALYAGGGMSFPITEPDLVTLEDRVTMDDASLVAHINSRGNFNLNNLFVGDRCVLRSGSRLLSGGSMAADSCLLEHTLLMGGDEAETGTTYQGWPADEFMGSRVHLFNPIAADTIVSEYSPCYRKDGLLINFKVSRSWLGVMASIWSDVAHVIQRWFRIRSTSYQSIPGHCATTSTPESLYGSEIIELG